MRERFYRTVFAVGVVAVFLEGAGAGMKWY